MGTGSFLIVLLRIFDVVAGPSVTLVYPLYASIQAIETKSTLDDQQWLTYWVLYSLLTLFELTFAMIIEWLPFWPYAKLIFNCWLVLPYFSGASHVYRHYVRPLLINQQIVDIWYVPQKKDIFSRPDDVLVAAEKFIEENGLDAFEKLLRKVEGTSKPTSKDISKPPSIDTSKPPSKDTSKLPSIGKWKPLLKGKLKPAKGNKHVTFDDSEAQRQVNSWKSNKDVKYNQDYDVKESNSLTSNWHTILAGAGADADAEKESRSWRNSSFMIFDDYDHRYRI